MPGAGPLPILVFAAGTSSRMGGADKLLQPVDGQPLIRRTVQQALATGHPVTVLLAPDRPARAMALRDLAVETVGVRDADRGMSASIRAGIASLPRDAPGAMFLLADMPDLEASDLAALVDAFHQAGGTRVVRAAGADGTPGAPSVVPRRLFKTMAALQGDQGGRAAMREEDVLLVPLPGRRALTDLDTPADWAAWRAARKK